MLLRCIWAGGPARPLLVDQFFIARDHVDQAPAAPSFKLLKSIGIAPGLGPIVMSAEPFRDLLGHNRYQKGHFHNGMGLIGHGGCVPNTQDQIPPIQYPIKPAQAFIKPLVFCCLLAKQGDNIAKQRIAFRCRLPRATQGQLK